MAIDIYLKLGTIKGESIVSGFEDQIQISAWSWGMSQSGTTHAGPGGGAGKVSVNDISLQHNMDAASPNLVVACCTGQHFDTATLTMRKAGGSPLDYVVLEMTEVLVSSVSHGASGDDTISENFSLNFASFKFSYQPQDKKGAKKGGAITGNYDIAANLKS
jgi:type VI secretion system secreted protein Hcp